MTDMPSRFPHSAITRSIIDRYTDRYLALGVDPKSLGWGSKDQQIRRFKNVERIISLQHKSILDIGCGFGDFLRYIADSQIPVSKYTGWDINREFIREAKALQSDLCGNFDVKDLLNEKTQKSEADIVLMLGLLNYRYTGSTTNLEFSKQMIAHAFSLANESLVVDFLSTCLNPDYPEEDNIYYHSPASVIEYCLSLTANLKMYHDYEPIPQREFTIVLYK
jgi:SAM-dependent methyltransferase